MFSRGVHHVSINVDDLDKCRDFYVEALGMVEIERPELAVGGVWLRVGSQEIHLIELPPPAAQGQHFSLQVDDLDVAVATLADRGVGIDHRTGIDGICLQAFLKDPSGNQVELTQPL